MAEDPLRTSFPSNSHKAKQPNEETRKALPKLVTTEVKQRKVPLGKRIVDTFTGTDARSVGQYVLFDVILPSIKEMIFDASTQGLQQTLFGGDPRVSNRRGNGAHTPYSRISTTQSKAPVAISDRGRAVHDFREIIIPERGEAEKVLDTLGLQLDQYDQVTVADLYDLVGITGSFTDNKYGWTNLRSARVVRVNGGYLLDLPRTEILD